jgi:phage/plasmid-like protein (TIGR03299 family)
MSHQFESGFFVHTPAWHRLGKVLDNPPSTQQAIIDAGLDWQVLKQPIYRRDANTFLEVSTHKALVRSTDQRQLGVVSNHYNPLQNVDAFKWFDILLHEGEVTLDAAGSLKDGKRIWILAKINLHPIEIQDGDAIQPYLLLHNSHDGSTAIWLHFTPVRVVCWNTLTWATAKRYEDEKNHKALHIRHNSNINEKLNLAHQALDLARQTLKSSIVEYRAMANKSITTELFEMYLSNIFEMEEPSNHKAYELIQENFEAGRGNKGSTLWDAYNGFTEWLDHQRGKNEYSRLESAWFGESARLRTKAHNAALALL